MVGDVWIDDKIGLHILSNIIINSPQREAMQLCRCSSPPTSPSIPSFVSHHQTKCATMRDVHQLHSHLIKTGLASSSIAASRVLAFSAAAADLDYALLLLSHTPRPNSFMFNTVIRCFSRSSEPHKAISLFIRMLLCSSAPPQRLTFPSLFVACSCLGLAFLGSQLHGMVLKLGFAADSYIRNAMISMYSACGCICLASRLFGECSGLFDAVTWNAMMMGLVRVGMVDDARLLFDEMPERTEVSWSTMMSGYVRNGRNKEALDLFSRMQKKGIAPNAHIVVSLLNACASLGALEQGVWICAYVEKKGVEMNSIVLTAIIDMYCKCGSVDKAIQMFEDAERKALSTWNAMISGLAMNGRGGEAVRYFSRLQSSGLKPDWVSFISILTACNHSGMVNEARYYFRIMTKMHGIEPGIEHYGCMVDVLGRAGLLKEAVELIQKMPMEPDSIVWGSLLCACRMHGNVEVGKWIAARVTNLDPGDSGAYALLSNMHADVRDFHDSVKARVAMKDKRVPKEPGCSMIQINGSAHEFLASGVAHTQAKQIYELLNGMALQLRDTL